MALTSAYIVSCHCRPLLPFSALLQPTIPTSAAAGLCHCNPCRFTSGSLGMSWLRLRAAPPEDALTGCVGYASSKELTRWFCGKCGCKVFCEELLHEKEGEGRWWVARGCVVLTSGLEKAGEEEEGGVGNVKDVVRINYHEFVSDTVDGGLAARLMHLPGPVEGESREVPCWETWPGTTLMPPSKVRDMERRAIDAGKTTPDVDAKLALRCHCGGVDLRINRADYARDPHGVEEWYIPEDKSKYLALLCVCRTCRLTLGAGLQPWCQVPLPNITVAGTGGTVKLGKAVRIGEGIEGTTLKAYRSSDIIYRYFCGRCGASVMYWPEEPGRVMVYVQVGLLRAEEGVLARRWLSWNWGRVSCQEEVVDGEVLEAVLMGVE